ncbi:putative serine/threonine dehydratase [Atractiella rhizophila]|nr:putative serine/threonine dehydratase [Atractiella rhizophila]
MEVTFEDVKEAAERIRPFVNRTPVLTSTTIDSLASTHLSSSANPLRIKIFFKCENFQKIGAFKYRGATNAILQLISSPDPTQSVITHSSGNHAQALALAGSRHGLQAHIIMPSTAPAVKKEAVIGYGAAVHECEATLESRERKMQEVMQELEKRGKNATFVPPFNHPHIVAGQGTATLELFEERNVHVMMAPVGGGGLLSGTAIAAKGKGDVLVVAAEPAGADDAFRSFYGQELVPSTNPRTVADGLLTSLGDVTYKIVKEKVDAIFTVEEQEIIRATKLVWERMKMIIEPSSAVPLAVALYSEKFKEYLQDWAQKKGQDEIDIGIIVSGGNVDFKRMVDLFDTLEQ